MAIAAAGVALSACAALPPETTPDLHGVVLDEATHRPIAGATVRLKEFPRSAVTTASDGSFVIPGVPKWRAVSVANAMPAYQISSAAPGYLRRVQNWDASDFHVQIVTLRLPPKPDEIVEDD